MRMLLWLGGYSSRFIKISSELDRIQVAKIGVIIFFSSIFSAINWGFAGWTYASSLPEDTRQLVAFSTGLFGLSMVLLIDRAFIYALDTSSEQKRGYTLLFAGLRILIVLTVSMLTSQAIMPLLLKSELTTHAQQMLDAKEVSRRSVLTTSYNVDSQKQDLTDVNKEITDGETSLNRLQLEWLAQRQQANGCWTDYSLSKKVFSNVGELSVDAVRTLAAKAGDCRHYAGIAAVTSNKINTLKTELSKSKDWKAQSKKELSTTLKEINTRVKDARKNESDSLNPNSALVLADLLKTNVAARIKWSLLTLIIMVLELLPFIIKAMMGRSTLGERVAAEAIMSRIDIEDAVRQKMYNNQVSKVIQEVGFQAVLNSKTDPEMMKCFNGAFINQFVMPIAHLEGGRAFLAELEKDIIDVNRLVTKYPRYASEISKAWSLAVEQAAQAMHTKEPVAGYC